MQHSKSVPLTLCGLLALTACENETLDVALGETHERSESLPEVRRVMVIDFDPVIPSKVKGKAYRLHHYFGWNDPQALAKQYVDWVGETTQNRYAYSVVQYHQVDDIPVKADGYDYSLPEYIACYTGQGPCHQPDQVDYNAILADFEVCEALNDGTIDELWLFGGPWFGYWESTLAGPGAFHYNSPPVIGTSCESLLPIMGFNTERNLDSMVHNLGHRSEATMTHVYGSWEQGAMAHNWDRFGLVDAQAPQAYSGCGSIHYPPNGAADYDYDNPNPANSYCDDFFGYPLLAPDPTAVLEPIDCSAWGCNELGYLTWWFEHLPRAVGFGPDGKYNNWWRYVIDPNAVFETMPPRPDAIACSSEYAPGWCEHLLDGGHGTCNEREWATAAQPTGWVTFSWDEPVLIEGLAIYDRACPEQVLAGHVSFSDGSADMAFGPLEDLGEVATQLQFSPRQVSSLTVHVDLATGVNPGLGEIVVVYADDEVEPCSEDSDCEPGYVCEALGYDCGDGMGCVPGCRDSKDCGPFEVCMPVDCFTCPCADVCEPA
jgi:hypothetical protein